MGLDADTLQKLLYQQLCEELRVHQCAEGELMVDTQFRFPDGDTFPIHLSECGDGDCRLRFSDEGDTFMRISYEHDVDSFFKGTRGVLLEHILSEGGVEWEEGALTVRTSQEGLAEALFRFGQALTRVYDLTLSTCTSRPAAASTFYGNLFDLLCLCAGSENVQRNYSPDVPHAESYLVDYRVDSLNAEPLFVFGVDNVDKVRLTTVKLAHLRRHKVIFAPLAIFKNRSEIPAEDVSRLVDIGGASMPTVDSDGDVKQMIERLLWSTGRSPVAGRAI